MEMVPLNDPSIVSITPIVPEHVDQELDRLFDECLATVVEFLESQDDSELD